MIENQSKQGSSPLAVVLFGLLSLIFAEVFSGSAPYWFTDWWGWFVTFPLYWAHALLLVNLALRYGRASLTQLYLWGVIFGLYESWITKVIWAGYMDQSGPQFGSFLGFAVGEFMIIALFWHAVFSFIIPILVFQMIGHSVSGDAKITIIESHQSLLSRSRRNLAVFALVFSIGALFISNGLMFDLTLTILYGLVNVFFLLIVILLIKLRQNGVFNIESLRIGQRGLTVTILYLIVLNVFMFIALLPERIPSIETMLLTVGFYVLILVLLRLSPSDLAKTVQDEVTCLGLTDLRSLFILFLILVAIFCLFSEFFSIIAVFVYLGMTFAGPVLFVIAIFQVFRSYTKKRKG